MTSCRDYDSTFAGGFWDSTRFWDSKPRGIQLKTCAQAQKKHEKKRIWALENQILPNIQYTYPTSPSVKKTVLVDFGVRSLVNLRTSIVLIIISQANS